MPIDPSSNFYTYLHCIPNGDIFYVGKGKGKRCKELLVGRNKFHKEIVEKYGVKNIKIFKFECETEKQALDDEIHQIAQLNKEGFNLVNLTKGGEGTSGLKRSKEWCDFMSKVHKGKIVSKETREKMSISTKGRKGTTTGMKATEETRKKLSEAHKGHKHSEYTKNKMSEAQKTRQSSKEFKEKMSETIKKSWILRKEKRGIL